MKTIITLLAFIAIVCIGCKNNSTSPTTTYEIWPLKTGNCWVSKTTEYDSLGHVKSTEIDSIVVVGDTIINKETAYILYEFVGTWSFKIYAINRSNGFYMIEKRWNPTTSKDTIIYTLGYKYPGTDGEYFTGFADTIKILSTNTPFKDINNVSYNCYVYFNENQSPDAYYNQTHYFSPGLGPLYSVHYTRMTGGTIYMDSKTELQSYTVK